MASLVRWISRKKAAASRIWNGPETAAAARSSTQRINSVPWPKTGRKVFASFQIGPVDVSFGSNPMPSALPSRISPWLMLPPAVVEGGHPDNNNNNKLYMFYSLAEDRVIGLSKIGGGRGEAVDVEVPDDDAEFIGSSHGWIASFNRRNCDLFLSNPLSSRHVKLPPIHTLPIPKKNLKGGYGCVNSLIISCSPDEEECRALMTFGPANRLAFCCPGSSTEWTPIGEPFVKDVEGIRIERNYVSFVYSNKYKLFFCLTEHSKFEVWCLQIPSSPRLVLTVTLDWMNSPWVTRLLDETKFKLSTFLVVNSSSGKLYFVTRVMKHMAPNMDFCDEGSDKCPYKTFSFHVHKEVMKCAIKYMDKSLDGLAIFIGKNHSFAMSASDFPELKPNSIYYADANPEGNGNDVGIFNYEDSTFSACYYPRDIKSFPKIMPAPMWFTPTPL